MISNQRRRFSCMGRMWQFFLAYRHAVADMNFVHSCTAMVLTSRLLWWVLPWTSLQHAVYPSLRHAKVTQTHHIPYINGAFQLKGYRREVDGQVEETKLQPHTRIQNIVDCTCTPCPPCVETTVVLPFPCLSVLLCSLVKFNVCTNCSMTCWKSSSLWYAAVKMYKYTLSSLVNSRRYDSNKKRQPLRSSHLNRETSKTRTKPSANSPPYCTHRRMKSSTHRPVTRSSTYLRPSLEYTKKPEWFCPFVIVLVMVGIDIGLRIVWIE